MISLEYKKNNIVNLEPNCFFYTSETNPRYIPICHKGFKNLEEKHAEVVSQNGGDILEVGFGIYSSANKFMSSNINSYTCIEINDVIYELALLWGQDNPNATIINGAWENINPTLTKKYDGIYYSPTDIDYKTFVNSCKSVSKVGTILSVQGNIILNNDFDIDDFNVESNVIPPTLFDDVFTQNNYESLFNSGYFNVYWQYFDGTNFVKSIS